MHCVYRSEHSFSMIRIVFNVPNKQTLFAKWQKLLKIQFKWKATTVFIEKDSNGAKMQKEKKGAAHIRMLYDSIWFNAKRNNTQNVPFCSCVPYGFSFPFEHRAREREKKRKTQTLYLFYSPLSTSNRRSEMRKKNAAAIVDFILCEWDRKQRKAHKSHLIRFIHTIRTFIMLLCINKNAYTCLRVCVCVLVEIYLVQ